MEEDKKICIKCGSLIVNFEDGSYKGICLKCGQNQNNPVKLEEATRIKSNRNLRFFLLLIFICVNIGLIIIGFMLFGSPESQNTALNPIFILIGFDILFVVFMVAFFED